MKKNNLLLVDLLNSYIPHLKKSLVDLHRSTDKQNEEVSKVIKKLDQKITMKNIRSLNNTILFAESLLVEAGIVPPRTKELNTAIEEDMRRLASEIIDLYIRSLSFNPKIAELYDKIKHEYLQLNERSQLFIITQINDTILLDVERKILLIERINNIVRS